MGASDSKLRFKNHIFQLFERPNISSDDVYWNYFWQQPESANDVFTLFTASDIRQTRDNQLENLQTLLDAVTLRMYCLYHHPSFPNVDLAPAKELLNCIRILTRILPFVYEQQQSQEFDLWRNHFFWGKHVWKVPLGTAGPDVSKSLGQVLVEVATALLFCPGFTIPGSVSDKNSLSAANPIAPAAATVDGSSSKITAIWETGVGCTTPISSNHELDTNKVETLRLLLSLCSDCLYYSPTSLASSGSRFLTCMVTQNDKRITMTLLCSLLNITLKYSPSWKVPYDHVILSDRHKQLVTYSLQYLLVLLVYPIPDDVDFLPVNIPIRNHYRHFCGKIHRAQDFQFIADSLTKILSQPINASFSYLPGSKKEIQWVPELITLLWDLMQCNKKFRTYLIASGRMHDYTVLLLYYIFEKRSDLSQQSLIRLCSYTLLYLTADRAYANSLSSRFEGQSSLPNNIQLPAFNGSYSDYLIIQLYKTITSSGDKLNFLIPTLLDCIFNISPFVVEISYQAASSLVQLIVSLSTPSVLFAKEHHHFLLETLLKSLNNMLESHFKENRNLVFLIVKNEQVFSSLRNLTLNYDLDRPTDEIDYKAKANNDHVEDEQTENDDDLEPVEGFVIYDSDDPGYETNHIKKVVNNSKASSDAPQTINSRSKGKGKSVTEIHVNERSSQDEGFKANSEWLESWLPLLPLHTTLKICEYLTKVIPYFRVTSEGRNSIDARTQPSKVIESIGQITSIPGVNLDSNIAENFETVKFAWNGDSLGWYESVLWGNIFRTERQMGTISDSASMVINPGASSVGVWNGTKVRLFRLQETAPSGPSLLRPRGAVDAVASSMIQKFGQLTSN